MTVRGPPTPHSTVRALRPRGTGEQALQVATSGNLGPAVDASRELQYELDKILTFTTDNHEAHIQTHTRLMATPWMRKPELAQKLGIANAAAIQQNVMAHIQEHMQYLAGNQVDSTAATAGGQQPGQPQTEPSAALGHQPAPQPPGAAGQTAQTAAQTTGTMMPSQPAPAQMPRG